MHRCYSDKGTDDTLLDAFGVRVSEHVTVLKWFVYFQMIGNGGTSRVPKDELLIRIKPSFKLVPKRALDLLLEF